MEKKEYTKKSNALYEKMVRLDNEIADLMCEYYDSAPKEKGKTKTEFYKEMSGLLDDYERGLQSLREKLKNPDLIQPYSVH